MSVDNFQNQNNQKIQLKTKQKNIVTENPEKAKEVWNKCLNVIRQNLNGLSFKTWFEPIEPIGLIRIELIITF